VSRPDDRADASSSIRTALAPPREPYSLEELQATVAINRHNRLAQALTTLLRYGAWVLSIWFVANALVRIAQALAGKETLADVRTQVGVTLDADLLGELLGAREMLEALGLIVIGVLLWYVRALKQRLEQQIEQFAPYRKFYEQKHDPNRSSSNLTDRGNTPPDERY
jgi:hypothetical protein